MSGWLLTWATIYGTSAALTRIADMISTKTDALAADTCVTRPALPVGFALLACLDLTIAANWPAWAAVSRAGRAGLTKNRVTDAVTAASPTVGSTGITVLAKIPLAGAVATTLATILRARRTVLVTGADTVATSRASGFIPVGDISLVAQDGYRFNIDPADFVGAKVIGFEP